MLGSNDLLDMEPPSAEQAGKCMDCFLASCFQSKGVQPSQIILDAPPKMRTGTWTSAGTVKESEIFGDMMDTGSAADHSDRLSHKREETVWICGIRGNDAF